MPAGNSFLQGVFGETEETQENTFLQQAFGGSPAPQDPSVRARQNNPQYGDRWKTLDGVFLVLNEIQRPQKAMFAGFKTWLDGGSHADALSTTYDEFMAGIGTGNFKRDVRGSDILSSSGIGPNNFEITEGFSQIAGIPIPGTGETAHRTAGLVLDVIVDPANLVPFGKVARWAGGMIGSGASLIGRGLDTVPPVGKAKDSLLEILNKAFIPIRGESDAGIAALEAERRTGVFAAEHNENLLHNFMTDNRAWRNLVKETGLDDQQLGTLMADQFERIKLRDEALGLPEPLNDTYARIYRDYGIEAFNDFHRQAGARALADERPLRRAILNSQFDKNLDDMVDNSPALAEVVGRWGDGVGNRIKDFLFELKERDLERFVGEGIKTVSRSDVTRPVFESMEKDYLRVAARPEFRTWVENLGWGSKSDQGFGLSPFHTSELHSQLQNIGVVEANRLAATPSKKFPGLSELALRHPQTGEMVHAPVMQQAFHTDPRIIDLTREYYARRAIETSQVLDDLVRGYGKILGETIEVQKTLKNGTATRFRVPTWKERPRVLKQGEGQVTDVGGSLVPAPGTIATETPEGIYKLTKDAAEELEAQGLSLLSDVRGFENTVLPKEAADIVRGVHRWGSPQYRPVLSEIGEAINTVQNKIWKPMTLFLFPGYFTRNGVTNFLLQDGMGMSPVDMVRFTAKSAQILSSGSHANRFKRVSQAVSDLAKGTGNSRNLFDSIPNSILDEPTLASKSRRLQELVDGIDVEDLPGKDNLGLLHLGTELGILRSGQFGSGEILRSLEEAAEAGTRSALRRVTGLTVNTNPLMAIGADSAQFLEDSQRMAAFLWAVEKKGMGILEARDMVLKQMVDFNSMTEFERNVVRKYMVPFYSWARNSTPLMFEHFVDHNKKWQFINKLKRDQELEMAEQDQVLQDRLVPEYIARGFNIPTTRSPDGEYRYRIFDGWIPQSQLTDVDTPEELLKFIPENLGPVPKTALELMFGESMFLEREFGTGNRPFLGQRLPEWVITTLRNARMLNTADAIFFRPETSAESRDQWVRFFTGFNTTRMGRQKAGQIYQARVRDQEAKIMAAIKEAAREGHREEIPGLVEELREFRLRGRETMRTQLQKLNPFGR